MTTELLIFTENSPLMKYMLGAIFFFLTLAVIYFIRSKLFIPGNQYIYVVNSISKTQVRGAAKSKKEIDKQERRRRKSDEKELILRRIGKPMPIDDFNKIKTVNMYKGLVFGISAIVIGVAIGVLAEKTIIIPISMLLGIFLIMNGLFGDDRKVSKLKKQLDRDILMELTRMVSLFKNSDTSRGFYGLVEDFLPESNALRTDLDMYISDLNAYGEMDALDRMGQRVGMPEMNKFIAQVKASGTATKTQFETNMALLSSELNRDVEEMLLKELKKRVTFTMAIVLLSFLGFALVMIAPVVFSVTQNVSGF